MKASSIAELINLKQYNRATPRFISVSSSSPCLVAFNNATGQCVHSHTNPHNHYVYMYPWSSSVALCLFSEPLLTSHGQHQRQRAG
jgi:hypothetical protein